jgi:voltage-gated potassium channel
MQKTASTEAVGCALDGGRERKMEILPEYEGGAADTLGGRTVMDSTHQHRAPHDKLERALDLLILAGALATIPLTILLEEGHTGAVIIALDWLVWAVFLFEFLARLLLAQGRRGHLGHNMLNLSVVVLSFPLLPTMLGLVRLARLVRIFRVLRLAGAIVRGMAELRVIFARRGLVYVAALTCFLILAGGGGLALLEPSTVHGGFLDGIWWAIVTASTVGYGDIAPTTLWGRLIAVVMMLAGVGLISTLAASITAYFVGQADNPDLRELRERTARIEVVLEKLLAEHSSGSRVDAELASRPPSGQGTVT